MNPSVPDRMKAAAIDRFGGPEVIHTESLPVPEPQPDQVLIQLDVAGIGVWDPYLREGELAPDEVRFPRVIGNDGAGTVVATGDAVTRFHVGDRVYAFSMDGGFYAEYVAVAEENVAIIPPGLAVDQAGALGADGVTALRGLDDQLHIAPGDKLAIFGASGGIGHIAVQLAKRMGAEVLAIASGPDGVDLVRRLGADAAVDGKRGDVADAARRFAPGGLDAALILTGGDGVSELLEAVKDGGRVAFPNGVEPEPRPRSGITSHSYDGTPGPDVFERLNRLIAAGPFHVEIGRVYDLDEAETAHREIAHHHLGKLAFRLH